MNQIKITKGKLLGIALKEQVKSRQAKSSIGYFDLNGKSIVPYDLKHYLRITTNNKECNAVASSNGPYSVIKKKGIFRSKLASYATRLDISGIQSGNEGTFGSEHKVFDNFHSTEVELP